MSLGKYFHNIIHILFLNKYLYKNRKLKLYFEDRVTVDFIYQTGGVLPYTSYNAFMTSIGHVWMVDVSVIVSGNF
jgi:hypothetical protein